MSVLHTLGENTLEPISLQNAPDDCAFAHMSSDVIWHMAWLHRQRNLETKEEKSCLMDPETSQWSTSLLCFFTSLGDLHPYTLSGASAFWTHRHHVHVKSFHHEPGAFGQQRLLLTVTAHAIRCIVLRHDSERINADHSSKASSIVGLPSRFGSTPHTKPSMHAMVLISSTRFYFPRGSQGRRGRRNRYRERSFPQNRLPLL